MLKVVSISGMYIYIIQQKHILALIAFPVTTESSKSTAILIYSAVKYNFILKTIILLLKLIYIYRVLCLTTMYIDLICSNIVMPW